MVEIMKTKLLPPQVGNSIIERPRLLEIISQAKEQKLIIITAPAGYGKTIAMLQFVNTIQKPVIWYQLDSYDNDPVVFMQYLTTAVQRIAPELGQKLLPLIQQGYIDSNLRILLTAFVNCLTTIVTGTILVFDDFHVVTNPTVLKFMQEFVENLPPEIQILIASRTAPLLQLTRLDVAGNLLSIGAGELCFTIQEISHFLSHKHFEFSAEQVSELEKTTAGWPAILRFLEPATGLDPGRVSTQEAANIYVYLAAEIFDQQPAEIQRFLLASSILETMTPEICDQLLNRKDSLQMLKALDNQQLFLTRLAGEGWIYKYHQLFREFLLERLGPERNQFLHQAAELAVEKEEWDYAVEYLITANSFAELLTVLKKAGQQAFRRGRWQTVRRWLELLSKEQITTNEWLVFFQAKVEVNRGRLDEAETWITRANDGFARAEDQLGVAEIQLLQARILRGRGRYNESRQLLEQAYAYFRQHETTPRFDLVLEQYLIFTMTGEFKTAEALLTGALKEAEAENDGYITAHLYEAIGNIYYLQGEYYKALQSYKKGEELSPERILPSYFMQDYIAAIYQEWGDLDKAFEYAKRNVAIKEKLGAVESLPSAYYQLALIHMDYGEFKKAKEYFSKAIDLIKANHGELFYLTLNKIYLARCLILEGRIIEAVVKGKEALTDGSLQSGLILAICKVIYATIIVLVGNIWEAERLLREVSIDFATIGFQRALCYSYSGLAIVNFFKRNGKEAGKYAKLSLELGSRKNYIQSYITYFDYVQPILRYGMEQGIEITFIHQVIVRRGARAFPFLNKLAAHPAPEVRSRIILPLAEIGGVKAYSLISKLTKDKDPQVRELAQITAQRLNLSLEPVISGEPETARITIRTLGTFSVLLDWKEPLVPSWRTTKARDLLAYLIHQGEGVTLDRIIEYLWSEMSPEKGANNFHTTLYHLRQDLSTKGTRDLVCYSNKRYHVLSHNILTDRQNFEELAAKGLDGKLTPEKMGYLKEALAIYKGDYLGELDYAWVAPTREYLQQIYQEIQLHLSRYYLETKKYHQSVKHLQILIELNPFSEEFYQLLMTAYAGLGDRAAIKEQYRLLVKTLHDELGLEPDPETKEFYQKLTRAV